MLAECEGYRGVVVYLELSLWKFTDASRDVLASATATTDGWEGMEDHSSFHCDECGWSYDGVQRGTRSTVFQSFTTEDLFNRARCGAYQRSQFCHGAHFSQQQIGHS
jgi:predicted nucleic acid-binding Zn ribbon protein